jgi:hypothetical protein
MFTRELLQIAQELRDISVTQGMVYVVGLADALALRLEQVAADFERQFLSEHTAVNGGPYSQADIYAQADAWRRVWKALGANGGMKLRDTGCATALARIEELHEQEKRLAEAQREIETVRHEAQLHVDALTARIRELACPLSDWHRDMPHHSSPK